jgi:thymidine phosphorylase
LLLAGELLELSGKVKKGNGSQIAKQVLESGNAYEKFLAICKAQGRFSKPVLAHYKIEIKAEKSGVLERIDNRKIAKLAKLSGAPQSKSAGILLNVHLEDIIEKNQLLYTIYAESKGELNYAMKYKNNHNDILIIN